MNETDHDLLACFDHLIHPGVNNPLAIPIGQITDPRLRRLETLAAPEIFAPPSVLGRKRLINYLPDNDNRFQHERTGGQSIACHAFARNSEIVFRWNINDWNPDLDIVREIVRSVPYVGRSEDVVKMAVEIAATPSEIPGYNHYYPTNGYSQCKTPMPGFLDQCIQRYPQSISAYALPKSTYKCVDYSLSPPRTDTVPLQIYDVTALNAKSIAFYQKELQVLSALTRHAVIRWAQQEEIINRFGPRRLERLVAGHGNEDGEEHIYIVPIPSIDDYWNADGRFRRVAIIGNGIQNDGDREAIQTLFQDLEGASLIDRQQKLAQLWIRPLHTLAAMEALLGGTKSSVFRSITPVILNRNPRKSRPLSRCLGLNEAQLADIESIDAFHGPILPKTDHPQNYRTADYLNHTPRLNLEVRFKADKSGPLLFGRGKNSGFGLMYPIN